MNPFSVSVFCASGPKGALAEFHLSLARHFGTLLGSHGFRCVNGGACGMMRALSEGCHRAGGVVHCVNLNQFPPDHDAFTTIEHHELLTSRQFGIISQGDAFVALPGGVGTLYEACQILAERTVHQIPFDKPIIFVGEIWKRLDELLCAQQEAGLMSGTPMLNAHFVNTPDEAIELLLVARNMREAPRANGSHTVTDHNADLAK